MHGDGVTIVENNLLTSKLFEQTDTHSVIYDMLMHTDNSYTHHTLVQREDCHVW